MTEGTFKVCLAGTNISVDGTNQNMTEEEAQEWLLENQVYYEDDDPEKPLTDSSKYVKLPSDM
jgi:hypothetical protein